MPETLKEWCEWAQKLDWQYRQKQTESKLLGHSHTMHKPHKMTGGGHEKAQAQATAWVQPLANAVTPNMHAPQMHQHQPQNSDTMDVDQGGRHPPLKCYSCGKLGHTAKFCRNKRQIHGCAFLSKGLNDVERNYDVHDKEMLGIIQVLEVWRHYLEGAKHEIDIWTDHQNLKYFMTAKS